MYMENEGYTNYISENSDELIKYSEYFANSIDSSINYTEYFTYIDEETERLRIIEINRKIAERNEKIKELLK